MVQEEENQSAFDTIIEAIGNNGPFQKRFNILFNFVLVIVATMPHLNIVIALAVPGHWCNIPGRELTNYTLEEWKEIHIPKEIDTRGKYAFSKCKMYNNTEETATTLDIIDCQNGWEFDKTWYALTAPSQEEWVCDKTLHVTNAFAIARAGEVIGTLFFGQLADAMGRKPIFFATIVVMVIGRLLFSVTASSLYLFFFFTFVGSLPSTSVFQGPLVIAMEISKTEKRAHIALMQCLGWVVGLCILPFIMWYYGNWVTYIIITTLPLSLYLFSRSLIIESPRWLASRGRTKKCIKELNKIAKINKTKLPPNTAALLAKNPEDIEQVYGVLGLFSSWRLSKNSIMIIIGWSIVLVTYQVLTLNIDNLGGNPFMNYFWQGIAEFPAYIVAQQISDRMGRRWSSIFSSALTGLGLIPLIFIVQDDSQAFLVSAISVFLKFGISLSFYSVNLQALEIYPTCVRQTGISIGTIVGCTFGIFSSYIVYMGTNINASYPYILLTAMAGIATVCGLFLPETLNHKLPETLAEASMFGANQNIWGKIKKQKKLSEVEKPLNV